MSRAALARLIAAAVTLLSACRAPSSPRPTSEGFVTVTPAVQLFYSVYGDGPDTAVVLHGGPGLHHGYLVAPLAPLLRGRTLIFYDQRGRGRSTAADTLALSADTDVADLDAVRRHFRLDRMTLVGHHWGAAVAGLYAVHHPQHVGRILMVSPFVVHPSFAYEFAMLGARGTDRPAAVRAYTAIATPGDALAFCRKYPWWYFLPTPADSPAVQPRTRAAVCEVSGQSLRDGEIVKRALLRSLGSWSWRVGLNGVRIPVLVLEGDGPPIVQSAARRWAEHLPDARLLLLPGPHLYPWIGEPARFARVADLFLGGAWPDGSVKPPPFSAAEAGSSPTTEHGTGGSN